MARNLIPELERLKDESEQDNTWLQRQQSDVGLLKSPWKSPGWKAHEERDRDRAVPEVSQLDGNLTLGQYLSNSYTFVWNNS